jgi:nitroreductase
VQQAWHTQKNTNSVQTLNCASLQQDMIIALSYFELLCQSRGIGVLWSGLVKMSLNLIPELRELLSIPPEHVIGFTMSFGKPVVTYHRTVQYPHPNIHTIAPLS